MNLRKEANDIATQIIELGSKFSEDRQKQIETEFLLVIDASDIVRRDGMKELLTKLVAEAKKEGLLK